MDELLEILEDIKPNVDFKTCTDLIDGGYLDSFDIPLLVIAQTLYHFPQSVCGVEVARYNIHR